MFSQKMITISTKGLFAKRERERERGREREREREKYNDTKLERNKERKHERDINSGGVSIPFL